MQASILVVDDTPSNITVLMEILRGDYRVLAATNGEQALKIARGDPPPDLILLDVMMPEMSGHEVCKRLKAESSTRKLPVIFVTAMNQVGRRICACDLQRLLAAGGGEDAIVAAQDFHQHADVARRIVHNQNGGLHGNLPVVGGRC